MERVLKIDIIDVLDYSDVKIIKVSGELIMSNSNKFKVFGEGIFKKGIINLIIDLSELGFIDSLGTLNLISIYSKAKRLGGNMCLFGVNKNVKGVFCAVGLNKIVPLYDDMNEAITGIKKKKIN